MQNRRKFLKIFFLTCTSTCCLYAGICRHLFQPVYCLNLINDIGFESSPEEFYHDYAIVNVAHSDL